MKGNRPIKALGEVALKVRDLDVMQAFYDDVVGLELMERFEKSAFFRLADGVDGHTQILALFDRSGDSASGGVGSKESSLDHIAFTISSGDYDTEKERLERLGLAVTTAQHEWVHWRSLYVSDPEGNQVEWVCYDDTV